METGSSASSTSGRIGPWQVATPPPLAAGQLVRELGEELLRRAQVHLLEQGDGLDAYLRAGPGVVVQPQRP
jgi:hypothetical protein